MKNRGVIWRSRVGIGRNAQNSNDGPILKSDAVTKKD